MYGPFLFLPLLPLLPCPLSWFPRFGMPLPGAKEEDTGDGTAAGGGSSSDGLSFHPPSRSATLRLHGYDNTMNTINTMNMKYVYDVTIYTC